jgi:hypothetical protein
VLLAERAGKAQTVLPTSTFCAAGGSSAVKRSRLVAGSMSPHGDLLLSHTSYWPRSTFFLRRSGAPGDLALTCAARVGARPPGIRTHPRTSARAALLQGLGATSVASGGQANATASIAAS